MKSKKYNNTILLVDDDPKIFGIFSKLLKECGHEVLAAANAQEAFAITDRLLPDLILLDILLPGVDGFEIAARLKSRKETRDIPLIFLTVKTEVEDKIRGFEIGAVDYITKPINLEEATARIKAHLTIRNLQRNLEEKNRQLRREITRHEQTEAALKESEAYYHRLVEFNPGPIVVHSDGKILYINNVGIKIMGAADARELIGKPVLDFVHPDFHETVIKRIRQIEKYKKTAAPLEERFIRLDGKVIDVEVTSIPTIYQGKPAIQVIFRDITERKTSEEALRQSETAYRELTDSIADIFFAMDRDLKYTYWNKASETLTGIPAEDAVGKSLYEIFPAVKGTKVEEMYLEALKTRQARSFENEYRIGDKDYFFEIHAYPSRDGISVFAKDITDHKRAEKALTETHQLLQTILGSTHMLVAYLDPQFNFVWVNRAYAEADDRESSFFPGKNHFDLYPNPENKDIFQRVVDTGEPHFEYARGFEYEEHPERGVSYWDWSLVPIKNSAGDVTGLVLTVVDITERVQAEEQVKTSLREKEVLLKEVHHRVKNNLQVINSLLSLQARRLNKKNIISVFEEIKNRIYSIALVHEKLYESKNLANINFSEYTRVLIAHLRESFPTDSSAVELEINAAEVFLQVDKAIPCALIINELVTNALKYAFPGNRKGVITVQFKTNRKGQVSLIVADNGIGLPADFDINTPKALGMQIIKALVKQLHGSLFVNKSKGTKFTIRFQAQTDESSIRQEKE